MNTNMVRRYGRSRGKTRVVDHAPVNTPKSTTILASIRLQGEVTYTTYQGGTTKERFLTYLKEVLLPTLRPGDIVIMDNLRAHHANEVAEILRHASVIALT